MSMGVLTRKGEVILVDDEDYERVASFVWRIDKQGYARTSMKVSDVPYRLKEVTMHRYILGLSPGDRSYVDHINGNGLDNRRENLRVCTNAQNGWNVRMWATNSSGFKGVNWNKKRQKWEARIAVNGRHLHLGAFDCKHEAAHAYNKAAVQHRGEFAVLNPVGHDYAE